MPLLTADDILQEKWRIYSSLILVSYVMALLKGLGIHYLQKQILMKVNTTALRIPVPVVSRSGYLSSDHGNIYKCPHSLKFLSSLLNYLTTYV